MASSCLVSKSLRPIAVSGLTLPLPQTSKAPHSTSQVLFNQPGILVNQQPYLGLPRKFFQASGILSPLGDMRLQGSLSHAFVIPGK
jgi:hypothetical protein